MSEQGSSGEAQSGALADAVASRARQRHARDKGLVEAARAGDRTAFGKLYDEWVDNVYDRAVHAGASAAEAREITEQTFLTVWRDLTKLKQPAAFGAKVLQVARRETSARVSGGEKITPKQGPSAEDRLTRATSAADTASDPEAAAVLREAAHALDEQTRDVLDLHFRQGLTKNEVAAVLGEQPDKVAQTITKLPPALAVLTRARVLWRGGQPEDDGLQAALGDEGISSFNASAVRTINRYAKDNDRARARSLMGIPPVELFAAIPLADAPAGLKTAVASLLVTESVPMDGSAFVKRDDKGEIVDAPKAPPPPDGSVRPGIENKRPTIDPKKAAVVAAAALAAERAADDESAAAAAAAAADEAAGRGRRERKADRKAGTEAAAAAAAAEVAADDDAAPDLAARKSDADGPSSGAKVAGAAAGGAALGVAGAAAAGAATDGPGSTFPGGSADEAEAEAETETEAEPDAGSAASDETPEPAEPTPEDAGSDPSDAADAPTASDDPTTASSTGGSTSGATKTAAAAGAGAALGAAAGSKAAGASTASSKGADSLATPARSGSGGGAAAGGDDGDGAGGGPGKWIAIGAAAALLIAVIAFVATRGGDTQEVATEGTPNTTAATTTTRAPGTTTTAKATTTLPTTTSEPPTETTAPVDTTVAPTPTTSGGGGNNPPPTNPPPTDAPTTTVPPVTFTFSIAPAGIPVLSGYEPNAPGSPKLTWTLNGNADVTVEGPGFSSTSPNGTNTPVCPVALENGRCTIKGGQQDEILPFTYRMTVRQPGYPAQVQTVVLYIQIPRDSP